ncbi:MAG TPA: PEP-utilizing enzyme [Patescibacteria group bacterium]|nr:PEP-utilizing enzyme [Patescibacteria group bacterium]
MRKKEKEQWHSLFTRSGFPVYILDLAGRAYVRDMKKRLGWGYTSQRFIVQQGMTTSYYSETDRKSFRRFIQRVAPASILARNRKIIKEICQDQQKILDLVAHSGPNIEDLLIWLKKMTVGYSRIYAVYRFPSMVDVLAADLVTEKVLLDCARAKDEIGSLLSELDRKILSRFFHFLSLVTPWAEKDLRFLTGREIESLLKGRLTVTHRELSERTRHCVLVINSQGEVDIRLGIAAKQLTPRANQVRSEIVRGKTVCPGCVRGQAVVTFAAKDLAVETGQVIVISPMITVDYGPWLKKVIGLVTDEGGLTSHAAIVAREKNIPCLVGTKNGSRVFHSGDWVELDAGAGVCRQIKKNNY